jgi:hypothetical protein
MTSIAILSHFKDEPIVTFGAWSEIYGPGPKIAQYFSENCDSQFDDVDDNSPVRRLCAPTYRGIVCQLKCQNGQGPRGGNCE